MKKILLGSMALSICLFADEMVYDLGQIEVVESVDISQNKTATFVDKESIRDTNSKTVVEALQTVPGVSVLKVGKKNLTEVRIRGFDNRRIPVYVDGIPVYVPYNRETDLGRYTTYDLSQISVSKGYVSPMYGPNTLGGAVNLVTQKPSREFEGEVGGAIFSGKGREAFMTLGTNQEKYYGLISLSKYQRDYFRLSKDFKASGQEDGGRRENSDSDDFKLNIKVGYTPNDTDEYSFNYIMQRAKKGNPFYASDYKRGSEGARKGWRNRNWRWTDWDKTSYYFLTKTAFGSATTIKTRLFYDEFYNELVDYGFLPKSKTNPKKRWSSAYDDYSIGGNVEADFKVSEKNTFKIALFQKNDYHKDISSKDPGLDIKVRGYTQSIGLENSWKIDNKFTWVLGLSYDKSRVTKAEYRNKGVIGEWGNHETDIISPQSALYYQMTDDTMLYASIGKRSNLPSLSDRYSSGFGRDIPNPNLKAETSMNYEIGVEHALNEAHFLTAALFWTNTNDYIARIDVDPKAGFCDADCSQYQNLGEEEYKGFEVSASSYWSDYLSSNISYIYMDSKLKKSENKKAKHIIGVPKHALNAYLKYSPISNLHIIPSLRYETSRYVDVVDSRKTKPFTTFNLKVAYSINENFEISAGIDNITDKNYHFTEGHPEEGRSYYASIRYIF